MRIRSKMAVVAVSLLLPVVAGATQSGIFRSSFTEFTSSGNATGIATGDFDGDGFDDIAVGVPGEDIGAFTGCGMVDFFYGGASGFPNASAEHQYRGNGEMPGPTVAGDALGWRVGS